MSENGQQKRRYKTAAKVVAGLFLALLCVILLLLVALRIYLSTSLPAPQLSKAVSSELHQRFTVQSIDFSGDSIILRGVRLDNPPGFPQASLAAADSVTLRPRWHDFLHGRQRFRLISLQRASVNLVKNSSGVWNYDQLRRWLAARKPSAKETLIDELKIDNGSLMVQGEGLQGVSLQVFNIASKGSLDSRLDLAFQDAAHNRYAVTGKGRGGADAAIDVTVTAPSLSLKETAAVLKVKNAALLEGGTGSLTVHATLHKGVASTTGDFSFSGMHLPPPSRLPVRGALHFVADYDMGADSLRLKSCSVNIDKLVKLHAEGQANSLKSERHFSLRIVMEDFDLNALNLVVPELARKHVSVAGKVRCDGLDLEGDRRHGLKKASGILALREGSATREGRLLIEGLGGTATFDRLDGVIVAKGKLAVPGHHEKALLQSLDTPFSLTTSPKLKPLRGEISPFSATVMGIGATGRAAYDAAKANPITASFKVPAAKLAAFNDELKRYGISAESGTAAAAVDVAGKTANDFSATARVELQDVRGSRGKNFFGVKKASSSAEVRREGGRLQARGDANLSGLTLDGGKGDARFHFRTADGIIYLDQVRAGASGVDVSAARMQGPIPVKETAGSVTRYPIVLDMEGVAVKRGEIEAGGLSGRMRGNFYSDGTGRWLDGTANIHAAALTVKGKQVAAPVVEASFSKSGGRATVSGTVLGGRLSGTVAFDPFDAKAGEKFILDVSGAEVAAAAPFLSKGTAYQPSAGVVDLKLDGSYSGREGLSCRFDSKGSAVAIKGAGGKTIVAGAGLAVTGSMAGGNLAIRSGEISAGPGIVVKLKGEVAQALKPERRGTLLFSLQQSSLNSVIDSFVNILPSFVQEANVDGTVAADGKLDLHEGHELLEGGLTISRAKFEVPSQKFVVADVGGKIPFSVDLSGKVQPKPPEMISFSRENYPRILPQLRKPAAGSVISAGKIAFGGVETVNLAITVLAANGLTEITSLKSSLFGGELYGTGYITIIKGLKYRTDLLINNISLKTICRELPGITGYISGRVDGVLSLSGQGTKITDITGFTDLWAREGSGEKMLVSKEFLQRLAKQKLGGFLFRSDRRYDRAELKALLQGGYLTFNTLTIEHTNFFGVRDLNVSVAPSQNMITLEHLFDSIKEAAVRGKPTTAKPTEKPEEKPEGKREEKPAATPEFKWAE